MKLATQLCLALLACAGIAGAASAQPNYPNKPIHYIVPFGPGGSTDLLGRIVAQHLQDSWGQPVTLLATQPNMLVINPSRRWPRAMSRNLLKP